VMLGLHLGMLKIEHNSNGKEAPGCF